jgi:hypothetical protein
MSQYPAPYSPPPPGYAQQAYWDPTRELLAPARRASTFMFVYGGLIMFCGGCSLANTALMRSPETVRQMQELLPNVQMPSARETAVAAGALLIASILFVALGAWVRGGRRRSAVTAIVFVALILLWQALSLVAGLLSGVPRAALGVSLCMSTLLVIVPMIVLLVWLVQAVRSSGQADWARAYAQHWQYGQQPYPYGYAPPPGSPQHPAQGYGQQEGGMIPAPPPPPFPPPPEPPPQQ